MAPHGGRSPTTICRRTTLVAGKTAAPVASAPRLGVTRADRSHDGGRPFFHSRPTPATWGPPMRSWLGAIVGAIVVLGLIAGGLLYVFWDQFVPIAAMGINYARYMIAPAGAIATRDQRRLEGDSKRRRPAPASTAARRDRGRLAELQQDAHLEPLLAAQSDQQHRTPTSSKFCALMTPGNIPASTPGCSR